jgi:hypothetical protein
MHCIVAIAIAPAGIPVLCAALLNAQTPSTLALASHCITQHQHRKTLNLSQTLLQILLRITHHPQLHQTLQRHNQAAA